MLASTVLVDDSGSMTRGGLTIEQPRQIAVAASPMLSVRTRTVSLRTLMHDAGQRLLADDAYPPASAQINQCDWDAAG